MASDRPVREILRTIIFALGGLLLLVGILAHQYRRLSG